MMSSIGHRVLIDTKVERAVDTSYSESAWCALLGPLLGTLGPTDAPTPSGGGECNPQAANTRRHLSRDRGMRMETSRRISCVQVRSPFVPCGVKSKGPWTCASSSRVTAHIRHHSNKQSSKAARHSQRHSQKHARSSNAKHCQLSLRRRERLPAQALACTRHKQHHSEPAATGVLNMGCPQPVTVGRYLAGRLRDVGCTHVFAVAGCAPSAASLGRCSSRRPASPAQSAKRSQLLPVCHALPLCAPRVPCLSTARFHTAIPDAALPSVQHPSPQWP
jgi:hypothetical protein